MSYHEKRSIVSLICSIVITALYCAFMAQRYPDSGEYSPAVFQFWGAFFIILIPVSIVGNIVAYIVFGIITAIITREEDRMITDERDKLIELKSSQYAQWVFVVGVILGMGALAINLPPSIMFIILIGAGVLSSITTDLTRLYAYRRGV